MNMAKIKGNRIVVNNLLSGFLIAIGGPVVIILLVYYNFINFTWPILLFTVSLPVLGILGIRVIPIQHVGVVTFFGARYRDYIGEGLGWVFWPIMGVIPVDTRSQNLDASGSKAPSKDSVYIGFNFDFQITVTDPYLFLGVTNPTESIINASKAIFLHVISGHMALEIPFFKEKLSKEILESLNKTSNTQFGIDILLFNITDIRLPEEIENLFPFIEHIRLQYPEIPLEHVINIVQIERGKTDKLIIDSKALEEVAKNFRPRPLEKFGS